MPASRNRYSIGIGYILFIAGSSVTVWLASGAWQGYLSQSWTAQKAIIYQSSMVEETRQGTNPLYSHNLSYRYEHEDQTFTGTRVYAMEVPFQSQAIVEQRIAEYPVGSLKSVYVNPDAPQQAVLMQGVSIQLVLALIASLACLLVGIVTIRKAV